MPQMAAERRMMRLDLLKSQRRCSKVLRHWKKELQNCWAQDYWTQETD